MIFATPAMEQILFRFVQEPQEIGILRHKENGANFIWICSGTPGNRNPQT